MSEVSAAPAAPVPPTTPGFDFGKPFSYVFDDPRWVQKILVGGLFYLLGFLIIGWFFVMGYMSRTTRNIIAGVEEPLPEWENVGEFFNEGARLIGVILCYVLPFIAIVMAFMVPAIISDAADNQVIENLSGAFASCLSCLMVPMILLFIFFLPASLLFAIAEQRFGAAFEFGRIWAFIKANIGNYLLAIVVYLIARFLSGLGIFLLCVGVIFTGFWSFLIMTHGFAQAYKLRKA